MIDIRQFDDPQTTSRRLREMEFYCFAAGGRRRDFFHAVDLLQLALRLRRFARLGPEAIGEELKRRDFFLLILVGRELLFFAGGLLFDVAVPVAAITDQFP